MCILVRVERLFGLLLKRRQIPAVSKTVESNETTPSHPDDCAVRVKSVLFAPEISATWSLYE
jgi:hypothetical protein